MAVLKPVVARAAAVTGRFLPAVAGGLAGDDSVVCGSLGVDVVGEAE